MNKIFYQDEIKNMLAVIRLGVNLEFDNGNKIVSDTSLNLLTVVLKSGENGYSWNADIIGLERAIEDTGYKTRLF